MSSLADLTNYNTPIQPNSTEIRTEYLEPITSSTYKHTFRMDASGYLDTNSMIVFKLNATADAGKHRVNLWNGVLGGIKRCIFQVGDNIINDIQDVYKYSTLKNMNVAPSVRNNYHGHYLGNSLWIDTQEEPNEAPSSCGNLGDTYALTEGSTIGAYVVNGKRSGGYFGNLDIREPSGGTPLGTTQAINSMPINLSTGDNFQYGIPLGMLIPALKGQKIPLFLFDKQRILITVEFNTSDYYCNSYTDHKTAFANGTTGNDASSNGISPSGAVVPANVQMVVDYIIMPSDVQNEITEQTKKQGGYQLEFYDVVNVEKNVPASQADVEHRIGQNNREVHNIMMWKQPQTISQLKDQNLRGAALMCGNKQSSQGYGMEEYNVNIDGRDEFDHFVYSPIAQYNELSNCLGSDFKVVRPQYCNDDNTAQSELATVYGGLLGTMKPLGLSLRNGEPLVVGGGRQIGNYPIIWKWKRVPHATASGNSVKDDEAIKCNYFCELSRVANIMNTGKGMNVVVSY
tara:strand:+ start:185 stop:1726 length:1542 start_codon:yes stop_codon:yes gene_type:complete